LRGEKTWRGGRVAVNKTRRRWIGFEEKPENKGENTSNQQQLNEQAHKLNNADY
jgi:hypothetical protein